MLALSHDTDDIVPESSVDTNIGLSESSLSRRNAIQTLHELAKRGNTEDKKAWNRQYSRNRRAKEKKEKAEAEAEKAKQSAQAEAAQDATKDTAQDATKDTAKDATKDAAKDATKDAVNKATAKDAAKDAAYNARNEPHDYEAMRPIKGFPESNVRNEGRLQDLFLQGSKRRPTDH
ncbi:hypothetical protein EIP91_004023 [Steccherinum ochraceum]|uniref:Uncharacterized protein n=1 Tax=Steccherinum ochraceum TaxID=92696 RepID=A0A4R0RFU2_9APHY|nr:hypothetical protein EIP91_004023 [Steccherinum ochraceum]